MALDRNHAKDTLFGGLKQKSEASSNSSSSPNFIESSQDTKPTIKNKELAKWQSFEKINALLTSQQKSGLDELAKKIMRNRSHITEVHKERITTNTILRAIVENFLILVKDVEIISIQNEDQLIEWVKILINQNNNTY